jgi:hypothetical protein
MPFELFEIPSSAIERRGGFSFAAPVRAEVPSDDVDHPFRSVSVRVVNLLPSA